jgi:protein-tyrosine phosphatase
MAALRRRAGAAWRKLRHAADAALHGPRFRAAKRRLQAMRRPSSIVVICHGNICRSPYLEVLLRQALPDIDVTSAGFVGPGRGVPQHSRTIAERRGLDLSAHRSQLVHRDALRVIDLAVVMDANQARALSLGYGVPAARIVIAGDIDPRGGEKREILDPWNQSLETFERSFARLDRCAESLVSILNGEE